MSDTLNVKGAPAVAVQRVVSGHETPETFVTVPMSELVKARKLLEILQTPMVRYTTPAEMEKDAKREREQAMYQLDLWVKRYVR